MQTTTNNRTHDSRLAAFARPNFTGCSPVVYWHGIACRWDGEEPDWDSIHVHDEDEFAAHFGLPATDERAEEIVLRGDAEGLWDAASEAFESMSEDDRRCREE